MTVAGRLRVVRHYEPLPEAEMGAVLRRVYAILLDPAQPGDDLTQTARTDRISVTTVGGEGADGHYRDFSR